MLNSLRAVIAVTVVLTAVFAGSAWASAGVDANGLGLELALLAANTLPLALVGRNPLLVVLIFSIAYPTWVVTGHPAHLLQSLPTLTALYATGAWDRPLAVRALALAAPAWMLGASLSGWWDADPFEIGYVAIMFGVVWTLGVLIAARRAHITQLEEKTARLERAERQLAERAVANERARIARELHDVIAHAMSVITIQAGVGAHLIDSRPSQAGEALAAIERTGREAMNEMRRMLAVLHGSSTDASETPQPGLAQVNALAAQIRAAGTHVTVEVEGAAPTLSPGLDLAAFRVAQEALTNVVKHAPAAKVVLAIRHRPDWLEVEVRQYGRRVPEPTPGQGLRGMAERVALYDGELAVVPEADGLRVTARFPRGDLG